ncbi:unnamed protein product [Adineta ricciae]|uniref:Ataxin-10 domain-containing protein n=1 Tax=Adineta ricciae TaxID=249248 RepID=A0A813UIR7_ADIRI|nr:unnamed protein product [Adineta ricciae]CAF1117597.1 unnamed protein product [Adineta ricciae]
MYSYDDILSSLDDLPRLACVLKEKSQVVLPDSVFTQIAKYFLNQPITVEGLAVQRNLYGRIRSSSLDQDEFNLLIRNIQYCLNSNLQDLIKPFLQYLHNMNRLLPSNFRDMAYLCAVILLPHGNKNIIACILCAYLETNARSDTRYDLIINNLYDNDDEDEDNIWLDQLTKILIENDKQWLRKHYLEKIYSKKLLETIDTHDTENLLTIDVRAQEEQTQTLIVDKINLSSLSSFDDLHSKLSSYVIDTLPNQSITESSLYRLLSSTTNYPYDLHVLFSCSLISILDPTNYSSSTLRLFRQLILLLNNYYIHQHDLFDDNRFRITIVFLVSKLLCEVHRRRSQSEHEWYRLYKDVPDDHPLPTFDFFADLLGLLATLCYNHLDCQQQVQRVSGTIEAILSMTRIDLNQPKSQTCVIWLLKCLTEINEELRNYIKQIQ